MAEKRKKILRLRFVAAFSAIMICLLGFAVLTFVHIDVILLDSNIESMRDMAVHDEKALVNTINAEWESLEKIKFAIEKMNIDDDMDIINCLQVVNQPYSESLTMLMAADGTCYQSDGLIAPDPDELREISQYDGRFAVRYDLTDDNVVERRNEYMLIGIRLNDLNACGRVFRYAMKRIDSSVLDSQLRLQSYGGKGMCSVIDSDGNYIISMVRSGSVMEQKNFITKMSSAEIIGGKTIGQLLEEARTSPDGVSFAAVLKGKKYVMNIAQLDRLNWYFVYRVPSSVFSSLSREVFAVVSGLIVIIVAGTLLIIWLRTREAIRRTAEAENHRRQLAEALELAQQSSRAKTTFLNNMSHDIRTPINAVIGFTELANRHIGDKDMLREYLAGIAQSSRHLLSLVNDVLDMSRIESGKMTLHEQKENLGEIIHGVINMFIPQVNEKGLGFQISTENIKNEYVICDRLRVTQILLNLASNAVKYTPGGGDIACRVVQEQESGGTSVYEFGIIDNGIGIGEEFISSIFELFAREESTTVSGIQGTGLGLAITRNLVDMMNGTITCESEKGKGTEFVVRLPLRVCNDVREEPPAALSGLRALVVDENAGFRRNIAAMLEPHGITCDCCASGDEAVEYTGEALFSGEPYGLYLVGCKNSGRDIMTARRIRKEAGRGACIVLMSVFPPELFGNDGDTSFVSGFLIKPVFPSDISNLLHKLFEGQSGQQTADPVRERIKGRRVLLAEDNLVNMVISKSILSDDGLLVEAVENGREVCDLLTERGSGYFDVILMDVQMPVMDGYEATRRIRGSSDRKLASIPIIAMTANAFEEDRQAAFAAGMDSYIQKPFDAADLLRVIAEQILKEVTE